MWLTLSVLIQTTLDDGYIPDNLSLIYVLIGSFVITLLIYSYEKSNLSGFCRVRFSQLDKEQSLSQFVYSFCVLTERSYHPEYKQELHTVIKCIKDDMAQSEAPAEIIEYCSLLL